MRLSVYRLVCRRVWHVFEWLQHDTQSEVNKGLSCVTRGQRSGAKSASGLVCNALQTVHYCAVVQSGDFVHYFIPTTPGTTERGKTGNVQPRLAMSGVFGVDAVLCASEQARIAQQEDYERTLQYLPH